MRISDLKRAARAAPTAATIVSDGCRDYVVQIRRPRGIGILQDRKGRPLRFASLAEAKRTVQRARVTDISLDVRVAADEACAGPSLPEAQFASLRISA